MAYLDWGKLYTNHHSYDDIHKYVPGIPKDDPKTKDVDEGWETCCIQMSHAVNLSGLLIPGSTSGIGMNVKGMNYILAVPNMRDFLNSAFSQAENYSGNRTTMISQIVDRRGIIGFGDRHIDLWKKTNIHRPDYYILSALWEAKSTKRDGIYFWEVAYDENLGF